ncbi:hypothetical protein CU666_16835 [Pseudomonas syringae pv. actinidifoliorum]|nr:hypothetical protein [Pseudomonas syringae pv. actinidifoliorum]NAT59706.1 hypothetical protein [Pseudomonas syringae pv. actinidifoliorum]
MTTNVICRIQKVLASDSRWSTDPLADQPTCIAFVDNTGFDKLAVSSLYALVFAGDGELIARWKTWFLAPALNFASVPPVHRLIPDTNKLRSIVISLVKNSTAEVIFASGDFMAHREDARFAGSGAQFAKSCYAVNSCAKIAVNTAGASDPATGGETKFVELSTGKNNLSVMQATLFDMKNALEQRGFIMDTITKAVTPISEWMPEAVGARRALASAVASVSAPTGLPTRCWTDEEQSDLIRALHQVAAEEHRQA